MKKATTAALTGLLFLLLTLPAQAQEQLSLEKCLQLASENNLQLRQAENSLELATTTYQYSLYNYLPNLNFNIDYSWQFGTTFSTITFTRESNTTIGFSRPNLSSSVDLFTGFKRNNDRSRAKADMMASGYALERFGNDLTTNIVFAFLQVVFDEENIKLAQGRKELIEKQLERTEKEVEAGVKVQGDLYTIKAQLATEKLTLLNAKNQREKDLLTLVQTLNLPYDEYELVKPDPASFSIDEIQPQYQQVYKYAIANMPEIKEQEQRIISSEYAYKSSKSGLYPRLTLSGGLASNYSTQGIGTFQNGMFTTVDSGYIWQLDLNRNSFLALNLSVPIFNRMQVRSLMASQEVQMMNAQLEKENQELVLERKIQQAYLDVTASQARYKAAEQQLIALKEARGYAQKRFDAGAINFVTYMETVNAQTQAESELLQSKYNYIITTKILDLYQGKPITFE